MTYKNAIDGKNPYAIGIRAVLVHGVRKSFNNPGERSGFSTNITEWYIRPFSLDIGRLYTKQNFIGANQVSYFKDPIN